MASTEVQRHTGVDVEDVPSAAWGWSGTAPRVWHVVLIVVAGFLLMMLDGNQVGFTGDAYLIGFAVVLVVIAVRDWYLRRRGLIR